ncbi:dimethyl sulfone monooxygenase SfnG, partial [Erwinia amylovora]|nr:dimethyl sulfone monooxygenase SfnG [Erwinia amylovora]
KSNGWYAEYNRRHDQISEKAGYDYALTKIRITAGYGSENQHESLSFSQAFLGGTEKLKGMAALLPGPWSHTLAANQCATISRLAKAR